MSDLKEILNSSKRNFVVVAHRARSDGKIHLNDLCGASGRWDGIARAITSALFLSHDMRRDTSIHILLQGPDDPPKLLSIDGSSVKYLNLDERACSALMKKCLKEWLPDAAGSIIRPSPGISITRASLENILGKVDGELVNLHEDGRLIKNASGPPFEGDRITFLMSDDMNLTAEEALLVNERSDLSISLGPKILHTHMAIIIVHHLLDNAEG
jgi:tRNA (pseudouridine54-N1)-methyltransferase